MFYWLPRKQISSSSSSLQLPHPSCKRYLHVYFTSTLNMSVGMTFSVHCTFIVNHSSWQSECPWHTYPIIWCLNHYDKHRMPSLKILLSPPPQHPPEKNFHKIYSLVFICKLGGPLLVQLVFLLNNPNTIGSVMFRLIFCWQFLHQHDHFIISN